MRLHRQPCGRPALCGIRDLDCLVVRRAPDVGNRIEHRQCLGSLPIGKQLQGLLFLRVRRRRQLGDLFAVCPHLGSQGAVPLLQSYNQLLALPGNCITRLARSVELSCAVRGLGLGRPQGAILPLKATIELLLGCVSQPALPGQRDGALGGELGDECARVGVEVFAGRACDGNHRAADRGDRHGHAQRGGITARVWRGRGL